LWRGPSAFGFGLGNDFSNGRAAELVDGVIEEALALRRQEVDRAAAVDRESDLCAFSQIGREGRRWLAGAARRRFLKMGSDVFGVRIAEGGLGWEWIGTTGGVVRFVVPG
jgi:hypothetical protein